jgi:glutamate-1-semialdehyde 2,1-aminomutase
MATVLKTNSPLETAYRERTPGSARLYAEAARVLPSGVTHDSRALNPWPVYVAKARG